MDYVQDIILKRIKIFKNEKESKIILYFPENDTIDNSKFNSIKEVLNSCMIKRNKQIELIYDLNDTEFNKIGKQDEFKKYNLEIVLNLLLYHDYWHMYRIEELWLTKNEYLSK